jgi:V/A-type H+-transporting ATPase subunit I
VLEKRHGQFVEEKGVGSLILDAVLEWIVDVLEIFSGFLSNTLSFMRVAGLGIAHVSLMSAFAQIAELAGGGIAGLIVAILGNAMVIALEGLSAGIQALRLNYYEFFTKYFTGRGLLYNPISLRSHAGRRIIKRS